MITKPLLSVIVPTYNRKDTLLRALESINNQSYENFECIVVDDHSIESPTNLLKKFDSRFILKRNMSNLGVSRTRLEGYKIAKGEVITQLDDDNTLFPWAFERMISKLSKFAEVGGVSGLYLFENGLKARVSKPELTLTPESYSNGQYIKFDMVGAVRRNVVDEWLRKYQGYRSFDGHLWISYHMKHNHLYIDEPWGEYREDGTNRMTKSKRFDNKDDLFNFAREHEPIFGVSKCIPLDEFMITQRLRHKFENNYEIEYFQKWLTKRGYPYWKIFTKGAFRKIKHRFS